MQSHSSRALVSFTSFTDIGPKISVPTKGSQRKGEGKRESSNRAQQSEILCGTMDTAFRVANGQPYAAPQLRIVLLTMKTTANRLDLGAFVHGGK